MSPTSHALEWTTPAQVEGGAVERSFRVVGPIRTVPGVLWRPAAPSERCPLVLIGHGGSAHKHSERIVALTRRFTDHGAAAVAIDGPYHGERVAAPLSNREYQARIIAEGSEVVLDRMTEDWVATVEAVSQFDDLDASSPAYVGMSMGTRYGLPLAARLGEGLRCAVFGKFGLVAGSRLPSGLHPTERIEHDARAVRAPVLFHVQWDDEVFPRDGQLDLFTALGSKDKQLIAYSGPHGDTRPSAVRAWREFVAGHLGLSR